MREDDFQRGWRVIREDALWFERVPGNLVWVWWEEEGKGECLTASQVAELGVQAVRKSPTLSHESTERGRCE